MDHNIKGKGKAFGGASSPPPPGTFLAAPTTKRGSRSRTRASPSMNIKYQNAIAAGISLPSRPPNPYVLFSNEKRPEMRRLHEGDGDFAVTKALAQAWQDLTPEEREPWTTEAKQRTTEWKALVNLKTAELKASKLGKTMETAEQDDEDEVVIVGEKSKGEEKETVKEKDEKQVKEATPADNANGDAETEDADATEGEAEAEGEGEEVGEGDEDVEEDADEDSKMDET